MTDRQPSLFSTDAYGGSAPAPKSHASDPASSKEAARQHMESGNHRANIEIVYELVKENPQCTSAELYTRLAGPGRTQLDKSAGGGLTELRRRLNDLSSGTKPMIRRGETRKCLVAHNTQVVWETV